MAYFSNGSEGEALDQQCARCIHQGPQNGPGCAVAYLQFIWNYEQNGKDKEAKTKKYALNNLIHDDTAKCQMFFPVELLSDAGKFEIEKADQAEKERHKLAEWNKIYSKST